MGRIHRPSRGDAGFRSEMSERRCSDRCLSIAAINIGRMTNPRDAESPRLANESASSPTDERYRDCLADSCAGGSQRCRSCWGLTSFVCDRRGRSTSWPGALMIYDMNDRSPSGPTGTSTTPRRGGRHDRGADEPKVAAVAPALGQRWRSSDTVRRLIARRMCSQAHASSSIGGLGIAANAHDRFGPVHFVHVGHRPQVSRS